MPQGLQDALQFAYENRDWELLGELLKLAASEGAR